MDKDQTSRYFNKESTLANVALLYYGEGLTQNDIAKRMNVSRATVVNMLREARENRVVEILVDGKFLAGSSLSQDLCEKYGLTDVYISTSGVDGAKVTRNEMLHQLGRVGAIALAEIIAPGETLGVAWGETVFTVSEQMPKVHKKGVIVRQMIGSMRSDTVPASERCAIQIANMLSAQCSTLHAPAVGSNDEIAELLRNEPTIKQQLEKLNNLDMYVASIGHVQDQTHMIRAHMTTPEELEAARKAGAVGVICCRYINAEGEPVRVAPDKRLIAIDFDALQRVPKKLLIAGSIRRKNAVLAAIRGGYVTHLCVDQALAQALIKA